MARTVTNTSTRFWSHVDKSGGPDACWPWQRAVRPDGYGKFHVGTHAAGTRRCDYAHRSAWELTNGTIPNGLCVCHHCDNKRCCNPSHFFLGTIADNTRDAAKKGRLPRGLRNGQHTKPERTARGERHGCAKLSADDVSSIRTSYENGYTQIQLATAFNVSQAQISKIVRRESWIPYQAVR